MRLNHNQLIVKNNLMHSNKNKLNNQVHNKIHKTNLMTLYLNQLIVKINLLNPNKYNPKCQALHKTN